jgi:hypothetical protein
MQARLAALLLLWAQPIGAEILLVEPGGGYATIQEALDAAGAGDVVRVAAGVYAERLIFPRSGNPTSGFLALEAAPGARPILDGSTLPGGDPAIAIPGRSFVRVTGFEIRNFADAHAIFASGSGTHVELRDNRIHDIRGEGAGGIAVYGTEPAPITDVVIDGNEIYDTEPAPSEALVVNGNVAGFEITGNVLRDNDNIGIDMIGGEADVNSGAGLVARSGLCRGNRVTRSNSSYGGGFGAGIYVDGGRDIVIEGNVVTESDLGIEIGAENPGVVATGIVVRNNLLYRNERAGLLFGGYDEPVGRANGNVFRGNTLFENNTVGASGEGRYFSGGGIAEILVQYGQDNRVENNLIVAGPENAMVESAGPGSSSGDAFDYNLWWSASPEDAVFRLNAGEFSGFADWQANAAQDGNGLAADPLLVGPLTDFHLGAGSPAIDRGDPAFAAAVGERDLDGAARLAGGRVDIGSYEVPEPAEGGAGLVAAVALRALGARSRRRRPVAP